MGKPDNMENLKFKSGPFSVELDKITGRSIFLIFMILAFLLAIIWVMFH